MLVRVQQLVCKTPKKEIVKKLTTCPNHLIVCGPVPQGIGITFSPSTNRIVLSNDDKSNDDKEDDDKADD